jgi:hypothetical protein
MQKKIISSRDYVRWVGLAIGSIFIVGGVFKPVGFSVGGKSTDNALIFCGLVLIILVMVGVQLAKYLATKAGVKSE